VAASETVHDGASERPSIGARAKALLVTQEVVLFIIMMVAVLLLSLGSDKFLTVDNILNQGRLLTEVGLVALPMTFIIITGGIDLSVGSIFGLSAVVLGYTWKNLGFPLELAIVAALITGTIAGFVASLGARRVGVPPLIMTLATLALYRGLAVRASRLIYLLGGFTHYLGQTLLGSASWRAMQAAYAAGAVLAGSSAGAMVLCQYYYDPQGGRVIAGLGLVPDACVLPHHNTFGQRWAPTLSTLLPNSVLIGIDERTGMLDDGPGGAWRVYGEGAVTLYHGGRLTVYQSGSEFGLE